MNRFLDALARFVTERRGTSIALVLVTAVLCGAWIPRLISDPMPNRMTASSIEGQDRVTALFDQRFGNNDYVVVLLVQAQDVLAPQTLSYVHRVASDLRGKSYVDRVEAITLTPLPLHVEQEDTDVTLDDLDQIEEEPAVDPEVEDALGALVRADPSRFPNGLGTIAERFAGVRFAPAVEGDRIEPEEREQLIDALRNAPLLEGRLISRDHSVTAIALFLGPDAQGHEALMNAVEDVDQYLAAHGPPRGTTVTAGGLPHLFHAIVVKMQADNFRIIPLTVAVCLIVLILSFRWLPGMIIPLLPVGISALMLVGLMAIFGEPMNVINNIIPPLLLIIGISESIHIVGRYREELETSATKLEAAKKTVKTMAVACFLTSVTNAVGLASLVVSQTEMLQRFAIVSGLGVMISYVVTILFLPAVMLYFRPPLPAKGADGPRLHRAERGWIERWISKLTISVIRHPWRTLALSTAVTAACGWGAFRVEVDNHLLDEFEPSDPIYVSSRLLETKLDGMRPLEIMLTPREPGRFNDPQVLAAMDQTQHWLRGRRGVISTLSMTDYLHETWSRVAGDENARRQRFHDSAQVEALLMLLRRDAERDPLAPYLTRDGRAAHIQVRLADVGAKQANVIIGELQSQLHRRFDPLGVDFALVGEGYTGSVGLGAIVQDLLGSVNTAALIILVISMLLLRSWRLGVLSLPPNFIPLVGTVAWMALRGIPLNAATVIVFSISIGLAIEGSVHVVARYKEEADRGIQRSAAIVRALRGTGRGVVVSCATLMLGFGVMMLSGFVPVRRFGELTAVAMGICVISTLIVQPALLRIGMPRIRKVRAPKAERL